MATKTMASAPARTTHARTNSGGGGCLVPLLIWLPLLAVVLLIIVVLVLLYMFRGQLGFGGDTTEIQVPDKIDVNVNQN